MADFENVASDVSLGELRFFFTFGVAGEQRAPRLDLQPEDERAVVLGRMFEARSADQGRGMQRSEREAIAVVRNVNRCGVADACGEDLLRAIAAEAMRIDPHLADVELIEHRRKAVAMIGVNVTERDGVDAMNAAIDEQRQQQRFPFLRATVDEKNAIAAARENRVALSDIKGDQLRRT